MLDKLITNLKKLKSPTVLNTILKLAIEKNQEKIVNLNRNQIFDNSIDSTGKKLKRIGANYDIYTDGYTKRKRKLNKYQGFIDLSLTGDFLESFTIEFSTDNSELSIKSKGLPKKRGYLIDSYGKEIEGLTHENIDKIKDIILPDFLEIFKKELFYG